MQCCTAISDLQIESPFDYMLVIGQEQIDRCFLERRKNMSMMSTYKNWRTYRNTVAELQGLSNRALSDMGIARGNINEVARKAVR